MRTMLARARGSIQTHSQAGTPFSPPGSDDPSDGRFLSPSECRLLAQRVAAFRKGGGEAGVRIESSWIGHTRYTRNQLRTSGDVLRNAVTVIRDIEGAYSEVEGNQIDDLSLLACVRRAERMLQLTQTQTGGIAFQEHFPITDALFRDSSATVPLSDLADSTARGADNAQRQAQVAERRKGTPDPDQGHRDLAVRIGLGLTMRPPESHETPTLFFDSTYTMDPHRRSDAVAALRQSAIAQGMLASGYLETQARGRAIMDTWGHLLYYPSTEARYTVTVRSPDGTASGWAGVMWNDWHRVEPEKLQAIALDKCLRSRNPVRVEPGRYTTILEPQATHQVFYLALAAAFGPFPIPKIDQRLNASQHPSDPECSSMPFDEFGNIFHAKEWYKNGNLQNIAYPSVGTPHHVASQGDRLSGAYRLSGGHASVDEMIASTERGLLVTRLFVTGVEPGKAHIFTGNTRDGTWLIERGKISHAIHNLQFRMSIEAALNHVEQIGIPQRVYTPEYPGLEYPDYAAVVPALKVRDFAFTAVSDAI